MRIGYREIATAVSRLGVDINDCLSYPHYAYTLQVGFVHLMVLWIIDFIFIFELLTNIILIMLS